MPRPNFWRTALFAGPWLLFAATVEAAVVDGTVTDAAQHPVPGAMVSVRDEVRGFYETVYADASGRFSLTTGQQGDLVVRARKLSFADASRPLRLDSGSSLTIDLSLSPLTDPADIADNLPPSAHFSKIPFDAAGPNSRAAIQMTCTNCHSLGAAFNRMPRLPEEWAPVVSRMLTNHVGVPSSALNALTEIRSNKFAAGFDDSLPNHQEIQVVGPELFKARVTEWAIRGATPFPFGIAASSRNGKLYVADAGMERLLIIDPKTEDVQPFALSQPARGIAEGLDGRMYFTPPSLALIGLLDPKSAELTWHVTGTFNAGTIRVGGDGSVWWTQFWDEHGNNDADNPGAVTDNADGLPVGGHVGRFDPKTDEVRLIDLPRNSPQDYVVPSTQPYTFGIDIDPNTGDAWYSKLYANKIGRINAKTLAVDEFTPPQFGPRGVAFDKRGALWVAFSGSSSIASLDPVTMKWQVYPLPTLSPDETDAPYSVAVQPTTQDIWVTANQSGQMYRFIVGEGRFVTYPMPTRDTWMRDITFTRDGLVCGTSGPLPPINIEGGDPLVICVNPGNGNP
jgi:virginiamycin B lyase